MFTKQCIGKELRYAGAKEFPRENEIPRCGSRNGAGNRCDRFSETIHDTYHKAGDIDVLIDTEGTYRDVGVRIGVIVGKRLEV